ncbi:glycoside hydrolase family 53 protein [Fulvivirga sediminis]|uniref:Arabinogalactan endo-beta-1,4-galactanase n=1 Tax=Fulvivirga sediminis TaxID=2803949 RepID=A0A937JX84_9BACT|nr:glycosyl hydrolase 53 family protein [Fulvivirga sediminis]MBL3655253.1 glycosyl hydrolase 53 family protein [Fulvivirga sediminis]
MMQNKKNKFIQFLLLLCFIAVVSCDDEGLTPPDFDIPNDSIPNDSSSLINDFYFGADLSYANQIQDHNGVYMDEGVAQNPFVIFANHGTNIVRLRLWHTPTWTQEAYGPDGEQMYNDIADVARSIEKAKQNNMQVLLDFHYSDTWADPSSQEVPEAWEDITDINVLADSVYNYTFKSLKYLADKGLAPEMVQVGNEINCGMLYEANSTNFPTASSCDDEWINLGIILNSAIKGVREALPTNTPSIALHVANPINIDYFAENIINKSKVTDFEIIGFSYYPLWHPEIAPNGISELVSAAKSKFNKELIMLETAYPWTDEYNDNYNNQLGGTPLAGYPFTEQGQYDLMVKLTQEMKDGGGRGIIYWEPAWITSNMKDLWGTGSSWENATFFKFDGEVNLGITYMEAEYK